MHRGKMMEPQKQSSHQIFLLMLMVLLGISSFLGINVAEARLGRIGMHIFQSVDSSSRDAARLLQSVPGKDFYSVKRKGTTPPSGPSHGGNSAPFASLSDQRPHALHLSLPSPPEMESKVKGKGPVSGPSQGGDSEHPAAPPPPPSPTIAYAEDILETKSNLKGKGPVSHEGHKKLRHLTNPLNAN